jgi:uncharacterized short protein YbdD (DUF466 family)
MRAVEWRRSSNCSTDGHGCRVPLQRRLPRWRRWARRFWRGVREWCGDAAYERYLRSRGRKPGAQGPLTAEQFYVEQLERRYARPNRCC